MKANVSSDPQIPNETIRLDLSVEEFALVAAVIYRHLDGTSAARRSIEMGLAEATEQLHPHWRALARAARTLSGRASLATQVSGLF